MSASASDLHVVIIGAGTGGLCLAHGLKAAGLSVAVYERDATRTDGLQGYRVGIDPDGSRALQTTTSPSARWRRLAAARRCCAGTSPGLTTVFAAATSARCWRS